ncbi:MULTISPECIES: hypothetical protein [Actibacterium]|uniref:Uncharacterized protein n=1 Tax=Actibacterium naphthalenivorans TaxID=1614693 RepID=A0A840CH56_9RHOB|nr:MULTISPECIES: hypothetical protein [Actibacterium]ALG91041.1 hypothetical protein TQ29_13680 [Actibacterium sp. EMB200-NS6]MBB4023432.1 hypothetical protein [Actibacterium naphthalenivorans]
MNIQNVIAGLVLIVSVAPATAQSVSSSDELLKLPPAAGATNFIGSLSPASSGGGVAGLLAGASGTTNTTNTTSTTSTTGG